MAEVLKRKEKGSQCKAVFSCCWPWSAIEDDPTFDEYLSHSSVVYNSAPGLFCKKKCQVKACASKIGTLETSDIQASRWTAILKIFLHALTLGSFAFTSQNFKNCKPLMRRSCSNLQFWMGSGNAILTAEHLYHGLVLELCGARQDRLLDSVAFVHCRPLHRYLSYQT